MKDIIILMIIFSIIGQLSETTNDNEIKIVKPLIENSVKISNENLLSENEIKNLKEEYDANKVFTSLDENTDNCISECHAIVKYSVKEESILEPKFYTSNLRDNISNEISYYRLTYYDNGEWKEFNTLNSGNYTIRLDAIKRNNVDVEWTLISKFLNNNYNIEVESLQYALWLKGDISSGSNLKTQYHLEESSTPAIDSSGNGVNLRYIGSPLSVNGVYRKGMSFDGSSMCLNGSLTMSPAGNLTVSLWFKPNKLNSYGELMSFNTYTTVNSRIQLRYDNLGGPGEQNLITYLGKNDAGTDKSRGCSMPFNFIENTWYYLTMVSSADKTDFYINGLLKNSSSDSLSGYTTTPKLSVGCLMRGPNVEGYANVTMDELQIYDRTLSPNEVLDLYKTGITEMNITYPLNNTIFLRSVYYNVSAFIGTADTTFFNLTYIRPDGSLCNANLTSGCIGLSIYNNTLTNWTFIANETKIGSSNISIKFCGGNNYITCDEQQIFYDVLSLGQNISFWKQEPNDLSFWNVLAGKLNQYYNISNVDNINTSLLKLYWWVNASSGCSSYTNGTCLYIGNQTLFNTNIIGNVSNFTFTDNMIYPGSYIYPNETLIEKYEKTQYSIGSSNQILVRFSNISVLKYFVSEIDANCTSGNLNIDIGNSSGSFVNAYTINSLTPNNHTHYGNSTHKLFQLASNDGQRTINGLLFANSELYLKVYGSSGSVCNFNYVNNNGCQGRVNTSINNGGSWTSVNWCPDTHLHFSSGSEALYSFGYYNGTNSSIRYDLLEIGEQAPTQPIFIKPDAIAYTPAFIFTNWTASYSALGYGITYNLSLGDSSGNFIQYIGNPTNTYYNWNAVSIPNGGYTFLLYAFDSIGQTSFNSISNAFSISSPSTGGTTTILNPGFSNVYILSESQSVKYGEYIELESNIINYSAGNGIIQPCLDCINRITIYQSNSLEKIVDNKTMISLFNNIYGYFVTPELPLDTYDMIITSFSPSLNSSGIIRSKLNVIGMEDNLSSCSSLDVMCQFNNIITKIKDIVITIIDIPRNLFNYLMNIIKTAFEDHYKQPNILRVFWLPIDIIVWIFSLIERIIINPQSIWTVLIGLLSLPFIIFGIPFTIMFIFLESLILIKVLVNNMGRLTIYNLIEEFIRGNWFYVQLVGKIIYNVLHLIIPDWI